MTHVPLLVRTPDGEHRGKRVPGFVQITDLAPTILGRLNLKPPSRVTGEDLWPYVAGELYDVRKDPKELKTVAASHPAVVKELQAKLEQYIASGWSITNGSFNEAAG
ncbi:MAG: hypothetical protein JSU00_17220 [Acidobacteria bacterium]|nr:hypothetical protein [Acidobacteriota bacterium]